jgi:hypothetical protein
MGNVGGIGNTNGPNSPFANGPITAAAALTALRHHASGTVEIADTTQNIAKNLDALQAYASKISALTTTDANQKLVVAGTQYQKDNGILAVWGAGSGQTVGIVLAKAGTVGTLASYVSTVAVADSTANIAKYLGTLQTAAASGALTEITQLGNPGNLSITMAQFTADQDALDKIKNHGYTLAITNATVNDALGLDSHPNLSTNAKVKSIAIVDTTDAISANLDALQRVGLHIKSITQTDPTAHLTVTGDQYKQDRVVLGKIITSDLLAVIDASTTQVKTLAADHKVVTVDIQDTASNISRNWATLSSLSSSLTSVQVSDQANAVLLTSDQFTAGTTLLSKFTDPYKLQVSNVSAGTAMAIATSHNVDSVDVADSAANIVANMDDLQTLNGLSKLNSVTVSGLHSPLTMDDSRLQGDQLTATQGVLDKIKGHNYTLAVTGTTTAALGDLIGNKRVISVAVSDSSGNIKSALATLHQFGSRLSKIDQTDTGTSYDLTQSEIESNATVFSKIAGGYTANLTAVTAAKAAADALNAHVASVVVADTGHNILAHWTELRAIGTTLSSITQSDSSTINLSADNYQLGVHDNLVAKFGSDTTFSVTGATVAQAQAIASDQAVSDINVAADGDVIAENLTALNTLAGGKLTSITNQTPTVSLSLAESDLAGSQTVLDLIKGGSYRLALTGVDIGDAKDLLNTNHKISSVAVTGTAADIVSNLSDLNTAGRKLTSITQSDAPTNMLDMSSDTFQKNSAVLAKIEGGFSAILSDATAAQAATLANNASVSSLSVSDNGANLSSAWGALKEIGTKLTNVTQSDVSDLQVGANDWINGASLLGKFTTDVTVSVSGADVTQVAGLASQDEVVGIQVLDGANDLSGALPDLAIEPKITQVAMEDPTTAMTISAQTYSDAATLLGHFKNGQYSVELSDVAAQDVATLANDAHVTLMDVTDTGANVSSQFDALAAATNLNSIAVSDDGGTVTLTSDQILSNADTVAKISGSYQLAATGVAVIDLPAIQEVPQISSISISDTSDNVSANFGDILALGDTLAQIHLSDASPVLSLSQQDWTAGTDALASIDNTTYQVDVGSTAAGAAQTVAADDTVRQVMVEDTASNIAGQWDALISLYNDGTGKLTGISLTDANPLILTADQQAAGHSMITALLPDEDIQTAP